MSPTNDGTKILSIYLKPFIAGLYTYIFKPAGIIARTFFYVIDPLDIVPFIVQLFKDINSIYARLPAKTRRPSAPNAFHAFKRNFVTLPKAIYILRMSPAK